MTDETLHTTPRRPRGRPPIHPPRPPPTRRRAPRQPRVQVAGDNLTGWQQQAACPHRGLTSNLAILRRWHYDRCPHQVGC